MQGTSVENWVQYGLGLPQYRENFIQNAVTVLDFPLFLEQRQLLEQDLHITSMLHQRQILRAMHAIVLGIGNAPHTVRNVWHEVDTDGAMLIAWDPPEAVRSMDLTTCQRMRCMRCLGRYINEHVSLAVAEHVWSITVSLESV